MEELQQKWDEIKESLRRDYDVLDVAYRTWILPLQFYDIKDNTVRIFIPNEISQSLGVSIINKKYGAMFKVCIYEALQREYEIEFITDIDLKNEGVSSYINDDQSKEQISRLNNDRIDRANLNHKYTFDTFVVGGNNRFAHTAALTVAEAPGQIYNPLFLYGGPGLGKTHLMHAIGHYIIQQNPQMNVLYVTSEVFTNEIVEALRAGHIQDMKHIREKYRNVDVLLLDDIQFIIGKERTQEEFFNTFNELYSANKQIIISSDKPPKDMELLDERFRSRFACGLIADIQSPDYETRVAILRKNAENVGFIVDDEVIQYIANNIKSNIRELEGAFNKVIALSNMNRDQKVTISTAEEAIRDIVTPSEIHNITPEFIMDVVCNHYHISKEDILSKKRNQEIAIPRQIIMYLCDTMTDMPVVSVGKFLGKDHSTVIHGSKKIEIDMATDETLAKNIETLKKILNHS